MHKQILKDQLEVMSGIFVNLPFEERIYAIAYLGARSKKHVQKSPCLTLVANGSAVEEAPNDSESSTVDGVAPSNVINLRDSSS